MRSWQDWHGWLFLVCPTTLRNAATADSRRFSTMGTTQRTWSDGRVVPRGGGRDLGLLPDAQSRPPDRGAQDRRRPTAGHWQSAPALHAANQFPRTMARLLVARAVRFVRHGRAVPVSGGALRGVESRSSETGGAPRQWPWSSAKAHLSGRDDRLVKVAPLLAMVSDWKAFLRSAMPEEELRDLRSHGRTGRPLGSSAFLDRLERLAGRVLKPQKPGPKPKPRKPQTRKRR